MNLEAMFTEDGMSLVYSQPCECGRAQFFRYQSRFFDEIRYQHGANREHSLLVQWADLRDAPPPFEPGYPVREWLDRVHERETLALR